MSRLRISVVAGLDGGRTNVGGLYAIRHSATTPKARSLSMTRSGRTGLRAVRSLDEQRVSASFPAPPCTRANDHGSRSGI
ncbi:hypothetical protein B0H15DRAFT_1027610 [Mycena belliarum]|uniref:Uncharacterized protein n=1 Tax=Mycena belliarum TaxID=1033014 RepID=A0AAD6TSQ5_9AGAR|nr:hypothetical protein B0H15DRAFT_1027610 [Mycena belliae]